MAKSNIALTAQAIRNAGVQAAQQPALTQVSPLTASLGQMGPTGRGAQPVMPRLPTVFTDGAFGPNEPLWPMAIDIPNPQTGEIQPRRTQYPVAWNLPVGQPGSEGYGKLAPYGELRNLADAYSIARRCIDARRQEIIGLKWDIVPTPEAAEAMKGSIAAKTDWQKRKSQLMQLLERPDRSPDSPYENWEEWFYAFLEDRYVTDAVGVYFHPPMKKGGGWFGSNLSSLDLIDGTTIRPLFDLGGGRPPPSTPAFQQYLWGVPRTDYATIAEGRDEDELPDYVAEFRFREMHYIRNDQRTWTPYGQSFIEKVYLPIQIGLARQQGQLSWWTEGSVPYMMVVPGAELISSPQQVRQLQNALNGIAGDIGWKQKIVVLPPGSTAEPIKPNPLSDQFDELIMSEVSMGLGLSLMDIGISPKATAMQSPAQSNQMAKANQQTGNDKWLEPEVDKLAQLHNFWIQKVLKQTDMVFEFTGLDAPEDESQITQDAVAKVTGHIASIDEARTEVGLEPFDADWSQVPVIFTADGAVTVQTAIEEAQWEFEQAQKNAELLALQPWTPIPPGGAPGGPGGPGGNGPAPSSGRPSPSDGGAGGNSGKPGEITTPLHEAAAQNAGATPAQQHAADQIRSRPPAARDTKPAITTPQSPKSAKAQFAEIDMLFHRFLGKGKAFEEFEPRQMSPEVYKVIEENLSRGQEFARAAAEQAVIDEHRMYLADLVLAVQKGDVPAMTLAFERGRLDSEGVFKHQTPNAKDVTDYLLKTYPPKDVEWVKTCTWKAQVVPLTRIDSTPPSGGIDEDTIGKQVEAFRTGKPVHPIVLVLPKPDAPLYVIADGHHRVAAAFTANKSDIEAWVGTPSDDEWQKAVVDMQADRMNIHETDVEKIHTAAGWGFEKLRHTSEGEAGTEGLRRWYEEGADGRIHWGSPGDFDSCVAIAGKYIDNPEGFCQERHMHATGAPAGHAPAELADRKKFVPTTAAGLAVRARDTGRVLMVRRSTDGSEDPAAGTHEFPGGRLEYGETASDAAQREWSEEVGLPVPTGTLRTGWTSGPYRGFVLDIDKEDDLGDVTQRAVQNPDDPDGDSLDEATWIHPHAIPQLSSLRPELRDSFHVVAPHLEDPEVTKLQKVSKDASNYREATEKGENCRVCLYMNDDGTCDLVEGIVQPEDVCDLFMSPSAAVTEKGLVLPAMPFPTELMVGDRIEVVWDYVDDRLTKVGPHGYIHGWIFVGIPGEGDAVFHPRFGSGHVVRVRHLSQEKADVQVNWHSGSHAGGFTHHTGYAGGQPGRAVFGPREEHPEIPEEPEPPHAPPEAPKPEIPKPEPPAPEPPKPEPPKEPEFDAKAHEERTYQGSMRSALTSRELFDKADESQNNRDMAMARGNDLDVAIHGAEMRAYRRAARDKYDQAKKPEDEAYEEAKATGAPSTWLRLRSDHISDPNVARGYLRAALEKENQESLDRVAAHDKAYATANGPDYKDWTSGGLRDRAREIKYGGTGGSPYVRPYQSGEDPASQEAHQRMLDYKLVQAEAEGWEKAAQDREKEEREKSLGTIKPAEPPTEGWKKLGKQELIDHLMYGEVNAGVRPERAKANAEKFAKSHDAHLYKDGTLVTFNTTAKRKEYAEKRQIILDTTAEMRDMYPEHEPHKITVGESVSGRFGSAWGNTYAGGNVIGINPNKAFPESAKTMAMHAVNNGHLMPVYANEDPARAVLAHEFGHTLDTKMGMGRPVNLEEAIHTAVKIGRERGWSPATGGISRYGASNSKETIAEAFAEWHLTNGTTPNQEVQAIAQQAGWRKKP